MTSSSLFLLLLVGFFLTLHGLKPFNGNEEETEILFSQEKRNPSKIWKDHPAIKWMHQWFQPKSIKTEEKQIKDETRNKEETKKNKWKDIATFKWLRKYFPKKKINENEISMILPKQRSWFWFSRKEPIKAIFFQELEEKIVHSLFAESLHLQELVQWLQNDLKKYQGIDEEIERIARLFLHQAQVIKHEKGKYQLENNNLKGKFHFSKTGREYLKRIIMWLEDMERDLMKILDIKYDFIIEKQNYRTHWKRDKDFFRQNLTKSFTEVKEIKKFIQKRKEQIIQNLFPNTDH